MGTFTGNNSATPTTVSIGVANASGNRSISQSYNTAAITTTQAAATSTTNGIVISTAANVGVVGIVQNIGATTFDIAWTVTGSPGAQVFMWEAE